MVVQLLFGQRYVDNVRDTCADALGRFEDDRISELVLTFIETMVAHFVEVATRNRGVFEQAKKSRSETVVSA